MSKTIHTAVSGFKRCDRCETHEIKNDSKLGTYGALCEPCLELERQLIESGDTIESLETQIDEAPTNRLAARVLILEQKTFSELLTKYNDSNI